MLRETLRGQCHLGPALTGSLEALELARWDELPDAQLPWAEIVDAAAGFAYGFFPALALVTVGWLLNGLVCWAIGRSIARPLLDRWFGAERFERFAER